ncbi:hypothetical protein [Rubrivirga sp. IMCC45206]|uniref:hypothetical protein n=1 Tax=Rubrivirga sp. IMCC45206 TaxID=3391614 RepID=UPI0039900FA1
MRLFSLLCAGALLAVAGCDSASLDDVAAPVLADASASTIVVTEADMATSVADVIADPTKWFFYDDEIDQINPALGTMAVGPDTPPEGVGSAQISVSGTQRRNLATYQFSGTALADVTDLRFSTYNPSAGNGGAADRSAYLNFNVDFDGSDTWQRRLVYVPKVNGTVLQDTWQEWDAFDGGAALWTWSGYFSSGSMWPDGNTSQYRTWADLVSSFPALAVRTTDSWMGLRVGEPYASGYSENLDAFVFGTAAGTTTWDFEPYRVATDKDDCKKGGWQDLRRADGSTFRNQGQCIRYVNTGR